MLRSDIADLKQCAPAGSGAWGGRFLPDACHAAAFLREFVGETPWAHLDIAGVDTAEEAHALGPADRPASAQGCSTAWWRCASRRSHDPPPWLRSASTT